MAESISELYLRLGLDNDLESGFTVAQNTLKSNMARLSRQNTIIRLQAELDLSGVEDAEQRLAIQQEALNRQIQVQQDRVNLMNAAWQDAVQNLGEFSDEAQRALIGLQREQLRLADIQNELENLNETQEETVDGQSEIGDLFSSISNKAAGVVAGVTAVAGALSIAADATQELIERFRELQQQSYELNMSVDKTRNFLQHMRLAGGDIGDFEGYIRGITDAYVKGEADDPEFIALEKYGAKITDVTGRLKDFQEITEEVYQAWKKAEAAGEGIEFLQLTGGEAGVRDAIQYLQRYEEAKQDAAKISKANLNYDELHQLDREMNLLTEQANEFKDALGSLIAPAAIKTVEVLFSAFKVGTEILVEGKEKLQEWGTAASAAINLVANNGGNLFLNQAISLERNEEALEKYNQQFQGGMQENQKSWADFRREVEEPLALDNNPLSQYAAQRIKDFKDEFEDLKAELDNWGDDFGQAHAENALWLKRELNDKLHVSEEERTAILELYAAKEEKIELQRSEKIEEIREQEAAKYRTTLENQIAEAEKAKNEILQIGMSEAEAEEIYQRRIQQAKEETAQKAQEYIREAADIEYKLTHEAFENQLRDIERWKDAQMEKAQTAEEVAGIIKDAAMKEAEAFEREMNRIQGRIESVQDRIMRLSSSQMDYDLYKARKQYEDDIKGGAPQELAQKAYDLTVRDIQRRASEDKNGNYTKNRNADSSGHLAQMDSRAMAYDAVVGKMVNSTDELRAAAMEYVNNIEAVNAAKQSELRNILSTTSQKSQQRPGIEIIQGTRSNYDRDQGGFEVIQGTQSNFDRRSEIEVIQGTTSNLKNFGDTLQTTTQAISAMNLPQAETDFRALVDNLMQAQFRKDSYGDYGAEVGYGAADLGNFIDAMRNVGVEWSETSAILDDVLRMQQDREAQSRVVTVSPNITVNVDGNVDDTAAIDEATDKIAQAVTEAVERARTRSNNSYAS